MKLTIKNLSLEENNNFYTSIDDMEKVHKLDPFIQSNVNGTMN